MRAQAPSFVPFALCLAALSVASCARGFHPDLEKELIRLASLDEREIPGYLENLDRQDGIGEYYRDPSTREKTTEFFASLAHSPSIAKTILESAERNSIPPALAFALALEESDFRPDAHNDNGDSIDRGLFQLNSKSFPQLDVQSFYDPAISARYGLAHLQFCLRSGGNEVAALAMYNAGKTRVTRGETPRSTLNYVYRILSYEANIESLFAAKVVMGQRAPRLGLAPHSTGISP